ncbi:hypothetical protein [Undibacterium sp. TS12]|uniref:hypothetical protein n=1 Tax=Undibacterium sp. TS12 TaxID=2908202 RepID=UPI001F4D249B|nr:hypothetical protein [Undibacterium sp. TS12]MCH8621778.1 hypothetical protein [Undibacterium sp. TS12]
MATSVVQELAVPLELQVELPTYMELRKPRWQVKLRHLTKKHMVMLQFSFALPFFA